jgi:hypothetical protein
VGATRHPPPRAAGRVASEPGACPTRRPHPAAPRSRAREPASAPAAYFKAAASPFCAPFAETLAPRSPVRRRLLTLVRRRRSSAPPSSTSRRGHLQVFRKEVRRRTASLVHTLVRHLAGLPSRDPRRRGARRATLRLAVAAPGAHRGVRRALLDVLVPSASQLEHPRPLIAARRRSPPCAAAPRLAAGRAPPLPRTRETEAAGSQIYGPGRVNAGQNFLLPVNP